MKLENEDYYDALVKKGLVEAMKDYVSMIGAHLVTYAETDNDDLANYVEAHQKAESLLRDDKARLRRVKALMEALK